MSAYEELKAWCEKYLLKDDYDEYQDNSGSSLWFGETHFRFDKNGNLFFIDTH